MTPHFIIPTTKLSESVQESHSQHTNTSLYPAMPQSYTFYSTAGMGMHHNAATTAGMMPLSAPGFPMLTNSLPHMMPYMSSAATSQSATPVPPEASSESDKKNTAASRKGKWTVS